jgi:transcriptional regulator GlxA family with amidase domain
MRSLHLRARHQCLRLKLHMRSRLRLQGRQSARARRRDLTPAPARRRRSRGGRFHFKLLETFMRRALLAFLVFVATFALAPSSPLMAQEVSATRAQDRLVASAPKSGHARPLVVVVADSAGAETTDFVIPYAVLKGSGVADVRSVSTLPGPLHLMMALQIEADQTIAQFDASAPEGADIVIVPAQMEPRSPALAAWLQAQAHRGATIVSICEGARVLANAGLLHGRRATSHFSSLRELEHNYPDTTWVRDRRYVQDGAIISTTGVTASIPVSLALVEAIGGQDIARATAQRLGVSEWGTAHRTADFQITAGDYANGLFALGAFWSHETLEAPIADGTDELALALRTDAWGRSFRTQVVTTHAGGGAIRGHYGLMILSDAEPRRGAHIMPATTGPAAIQLDATLAQMHRRYGEGAERIARLGLEYDRPHAMASR